MLHRFRHRIVGPMVIAWLLLTVTGIIVRSVVWSRLSSSLNASGEANNLENALSQFSSALEDAENSERGYLLTGNDGYLAPFKDTQASFTADFTHLADAAKHDSMIEGDLLELRGLTDAKMADMEQAIKLRHDRNLKEALALVNSGKGREASDQIRKVIWRIRQRRLNVFSSAWESTRENLEWVQTTGQALGFLGLGAGIFALYLVRVSFVQERARWKLLEEKLRAEKTVVEKSAYLANMSHELRTPMNAILGFGELLQSETLSPRQAQYVNAIRSSGISLLQLINDVLDLSKLEAGKLQLQLEPTDLQEVCEFLQTMFGQQAAVKSLQLKFTLDNLPRALLLDRLHLRQVLVNLVSNALKFTLQGQVSLHAQWLPNPEDRSRGALTVEVADSGIGISPEKHDEIFQPFAQESTPQHLEHQGTGLGLSIVQRLTLAMGGTVALVSTPGAGSVFTLCFKDVSVSSRLPVTDVLATESQVNFNDFTPAIILAVDDNQTNRNLMSSLFANTHHQLHLASNGREALTSIAAVKPDIVLLDLRMPILDGCAALTEIRKKPGLELLPVIAITASGRSDDEATLRSRFSGFIRKPFSQKTLYQELAQFLPRAPLQRESLATPGNLTTSNPAPVFARPQPTDSAETALAELQSLHRDQWPRLRDTLAINETLAFAEKLRHIAQTMPSQPLITYANRLAADAETYAVKDLERRLAEFPALVRSLELSGEPA